MSAKELKKRGFKFFKLLVVLNYVSFILSVSSAVSNRCHIFVATSLHRREIATMLSSV